MNNFTHLHVHTQFSLLDGAAKIPDLVSYAKELGMTSLAITDHGVMYGAVSFYREMKANGIHPVIGCEVYVAPRSRTDKDAGIDDNYAHLILLAKNKTGYQNLIKLVSLSFTEGYYYKPRVDLEVLREYHEGIIALSACLAGEVSKNKYNELVKKYQILIEKFYDYVKISNELRDYDLKKNIEAKVALCEAAEKLAEEKQLNAAFQKLQALHSEWRELGPVPREMREEIWNRFKNASDVINKKHAAFYQSKKEEEVENLKKKTALCEAVEAIELAKISSYKEWDKVTEKVFEIQAEWKKIGFAPKKNNTKIYERFRAACDALFEAKSEYYKTAKDKLSANIKAKKELIEQAEALKDSTKWKETTEKLINLQKQWKKIGAVPNKMSDQLWKKFVSACDAFFAAKAKAQEGEKSINVIRKERDKLIRQYEANRATIATRENNIGFLNIGKSKEENPLVAEMLKNIEKLKADQVELVKKIKALEEKIRNAEEN